MVGCALPAPESGVSVEELSVITLRSMTIIKPNQVGEIWESAVDGSSSKSPAKGQED